MDIFERTDKLHEAHDNLRINTNRMSEDESERTGAELWSIRMIYGWFYLYINGETAVECSYIYGYNSPGRLLHAFADLLGNKCRERWVVFPDEPDAKLLKLERIDNKLVLEIYQTNRTSDYLSFRDFNPHECITNCIYKAVHEDILYSAKKLRNEFGLYKSGEGRKLYDESWFAFPTHGYTRLLDAIRIETRRLHND